MSARRLLTGSALALLLPASLLAGSQSGSAADDAVAPAASVSLLKKFTQRVRLEALPQIVQHGGRTAASDAARTAITATISPVHVGRRVQLQVQDGPEWRPVATARQNRKGRAQFAAATTGDGDALTYRVKAMATRGLRTVKSHPVSTARWLDATFTDEFTGSELDPVWNHRGREHWSSSRRTCSKGDPRAVSVAGGAARLSVIKDPDATTRCKVRGRDASPGKYAYRLSGHIGTQGAFSFRYGVAAARVKFQRLRGQHGAFWMQPVDGMYAGAAGSEIDVVEYFGDDHPQGGLATFMHRYDGKRRVSTGGWIRNQASYLASRRDGWSKNYHVFSVEWTPRTVIFRIDGKETGRMSGHISDVRQFPILSLIAADYEIPKIKERRLPQHMYVDWVRVWETPAP
ncbi:Glycosyl hydrolases family 16 [Nocardioides alpinus]|uniref:Glycoside hydrolase family 16 protein n=1 Tax=Nocardioides alpinus TaxID=748909 RepID=A0A1I1B8H8_9ACTN|nr:glycoside hydrolase family 16 protein [Nocardioides alpinus]PKH41292.1 glycoside hydrolase family 16 protein [Nocardioides alpinus]SFB46082.1 Glycosyl hydrolases family 16 [Nocardioides alpinus]